MASWKDVNLLKDIRSGRPFEADYTGTNNRKSTLGKAIMALRRAEKFVAEEDHDELMKAIEIVGNLYDKTSKRGKNDHFIEDGDLPEDGQLVYVMPKSNAQRSQQVSYMTQPAIYHDGKFYGVGVFFEEDSDRIYYIIKAENVLKWKPAASFKTLLRDSYDSDKKLAMLVNLQKQIVNDTVDTSYLKKPWNDYKKDSFDFDI